MSPNGYVDLEMTKDGSGNNDVMDLLFQAIGDQQLKKDHDSSPQIKLMQPTDPQQNGLFARFPLHVAFQEWSLQRHRIVKSLPLQLYSLGWK